MPRHNFLRTPGAASASRRSGPETGRRGHRESLGPCGPRLPLQPSLHPQADAPHAQQGLRGVHLCASTFKPSG